MITFITSYRNNGKYIQNLLNSFTKLIGFHELVSEVVIVDSNSSQKFIIPQNYPIPVKYIFNPKGTLTSSLNLGIKETITKWYAIFDADTEVYSINLLKIIQTNVGSPILLPSSITPDKRSHQFFDQIDTLLFGYVASRPLTSRLLKFYFNHKKLKMKSNEPFKVNYLWNQCLFVNKERVPDLHYNEDIYVWGCDFELSKRLMRQNVTVSAVPCYEVIHYGAGSDGGHESPDRQRKVIESEFSYIDICYPRFSYLIHCLSITFKLFFLIPFILKPKKFMLKFHFLIYHLSLLLK